MPRRPKTTLVIDMPPAAESMSAPVAAATDRLDRTMFYGMLALLMFGPLAFGGNEPWAQFIERTGALALFGMWAARQYCQGVVELSANPLHLPVACFALLVSFQFVTGVSAYRYATLTEALDLIPGGVLILVAGEVLTRRHRLHQCVLALSIFGSAVAVLALMQDLSNSDRIYWLLKPESISAVVYGPYANHNHYAGLMEMLVPLAAAAAFLERGPKRGLLLFATAVMAMTIVFSRSRGGILGLATAVVFVCAVFYRGNRRHRAALGILAVCVGVLVCAIFLGNDKILQRMMDTQDSYRLTIYSDCLRMWRDKPLFGFGWGTFPDVYPAYRSFYTNLLVNHAHNDYLELLVETGLAGVALTVWFLSGVLGEAFRKILDKKDYEGSLLALGATTGVVALLAHSALDFNLHISANAALFYVLCSAIATPYKHRVRQLSFARWEASDVEPIAVEARR